MQRTRTALGLLLGFGLLAAACGDEQQPSAPAEAPPSQPAARTPSAPAAAQRDTPAAAGQRSQAALSQAAQLSKQLAPSYPGEDPAKLDCVSEAIIDQLGLQGFNALIAISLQEKVGGRDEAARTPDEVAQFEKLDSLMRGCELPVR